MYLTKRLISVMFEAMTKEEKAKAILDYLHTIASNGGKSKSEAKRQAVRLNLENARLALAEKRKAALKPTGQNKSSRKRSKGLTLKAG